MTETSDLPPRPERVTGPRHILAASAYSVGGLRRIWRETAFRHEVLAFPIILALLVATGATLAEILGFVVLFLLLIATEALNTAIEAIMDHISPGWSEAGRDAKDLGSLAVLCLLLANGIYLVYVLLT